MKNYRTSKIWGRNETSGRQSRLSRMYLLRGIQGSIGNSNPLRSGYRLLKTKTEIYFYLGIWKMDPSPWPKYLTCPLSDPYEQVGMKHLPRKCFLFVNVCFSYPTFPPRSPRAQIHVRPTYTLSSLALDRVTRRRGIKQTFPRSVPPDQVDAAGHLGLSHLIPET